MHQPSMSVESPAVSENFFNVEPRVRGWGRKKGRKPQGESTRHEDTRAESKALLRLCGPLPWRQYSYEILMGSYTKFHNLFPKETERVGWLPDTNRNCKPRQSYRRSFTVFKQNIVNNLI